MVGSREIKRCEISMSYNRGFVIGARGFSGRFVPSYKFNFAINRNKHSPLPSFVIPCHTTVSARIINTLFTVTGVLRLRTFSQIALSIIQSVVIPMINEIFFRYAEYFSMHISNPYFCMTDHVKHPSSFSGIPVFTGEAREVLAINDCVSSLRQWDETVGWVERLNDFVSNHTISWHGSTSNGLVLQPLF